jgi:thymidylate synthase
MHLNYSNVNDAFTSIVEQFSSKGRFIAEQSSRNGPVFVCQEPVIVTYKYPKQRVLFNQTRDCNPFFHLYESLWMLSGRYDVAPLKYYNNRISDYSDDGESFNGAYGNRWRDAKLDTYGDEWGDQLEMLASHLRNNPDSRRAVLQMWNTTDDLAKINTSKDVCCNLSVCFSIREEKYLDMTVFNRSNDLIWGMLGANVVHFSFLQEYMAAKIGVEVGVYNQITNNLHVYKNNWKPKEWLEDKQTPKEYPNMVRLVTHAERFEEELSKFVIEHSMHKRFYKTQWSERFFDMTAGPMLMAFHMHKRREYDKSLRWCDKIASDDWRIVAIAWIQKRKNTYENKSSRQDKSISISS